MNDRQLRSELEALSKEIADERLRVENRHQTLEAERATVRQAIAQAREQREGLHRQKLEQRRESAALAETMHALKAELRTLRDEVMSATYRQEEREGYDRRSAKGGCLSALLVVGLASLGTWALRWS